jgi:MFS transporter, DHA1 family, solute carrier family 18 (vesicular amine transporter), member 1/2
MRPARSATVALVTFATLIDIIAYSIGVPVLPDLSRRLGASATTIGLLFASFGVTVLAVSVPMGAYSDRIGRRGPLVGGLVALSASTLLFAVAERLPALFAARLVQGAADAVTWVVGFALIADLYGPEERGRVMGLVMSGTTFGFLIGPALGGWLYERGGAQLPFLTLAVLAALGAIGFAVIPLPTRTEQHEQVPLRAVLRVPSVAACSAAVVLGGGTIAMLEPIVALHLAEKIGLGPSRIGLVFGVGAVASILLHPYFGGIADRSGGRRLTMAGLVAMGLVLPVLGLMSSFGSAATLYLVNVVPIAMVVTPSLTYMAEATSMAGVGSFGVAYGLYNFAWALGLLIGPSVGGAMYERLGFQSLLFVWAPGVVLTTALIAAASRRVTTTPAV